MSNVAIKVINIWNIFHCSLSRILELSKVIPRINFYILKSVRFLYILFEQINLCTHGCHFDFVIFGLTTCQTPSKTGSQNLSRFTEFSYPLWCETKSNNKIDHLRWIQIVSLIKFQCFAPFEWGPVCMFLWFPLRLSQIWICHILTHFLSHF